MELRRIYMVTVVLFSMSGNICWSMGSIGSLERGVFPLPKQEALNQSLAEAIRQKDIQKVEILLQQGADPNAKTLGYWKPLKEAIYADSIEIVKLLFDYGANPKEIDVGSSSLNYAIEQNRLAIVKLLLDKGADINAQDESGNTPLWYAAAKWESSGQIAKEIVQLLLSKGADPNKQNNGGETPLFKAVDYDNYTIVELLFSHKADPTIKTKEGKNALNMAFEWNRSKMLNLFRKAGYPIDAMLNEPNELGETRLIRDIAQGKSSEQIQALIELGANPYLEDLSGLNAFNYAKDNPEILAVLEKSKYKPHQERPAGKKQESMRKVIKKIYQSLFPIKKTEPIRLIDPALYKQAKRLTTSEAYAEIFNEEISNRYKRDIDVKRIDITKLLERERKYLDDYYVFYHAQNAAHRIAQDFWLEILSLIHTDYPQHFIPMRFWGGKHVLAHSDPEKFLTSTKMIPDCGSAWGKINDNELAIRRHLLSVNIALFGNIRNSGESSFDYYLRNRSITHIETKKLLKSIIAYFNFKTTITDTLVALQTSLMRDFGSLLQIFIPKDLVDRCVYLAIPWGCAYTTNLEVGGYQILSISSFGFEEGYQAQISPILEMIETGDVPNSKLTKGALEGLQARIIIGKDIMLNPQSGVKIFREVNLPKAKLIAYRNFVSKIALLAITDWLERFLKDTLGQEIIDRVKDTPLGQLIKDRKKVEALLQELRSVARDMLSHAKPVARPA